MPPSPTNLEYAPNLLIAGMEVTRSNDRATFRTQLHWSTILRNFLPVLLLLAFAGTLEGLIFKFTPTSSACNWASHIFPGIFATLAIATFISQFLPSLAPSVLSIDPDAITLQKRTLAAMTTARWERAHILGLRIARIRPSNYLLRRTFILLQHQSHGDIPILMGKPAELRELAPIISQHLGLSEYLHPALQLKPIARRAKINRWGDGIVISIASPFRHMLLAATGILAAAIGLTLILILAHFSPSEYESTLVTISRLAVGIPVALFAWPSLYQTLLPLFHETIIGVHSTQFQVIEKGILHPFTGIWKLPEVGSLRSPTGERTLVIEVANQELKLLKNENEKIITWTQNALQTALIHARSRTPANDVADHPTASLT